MTMYSKYLLIILLYCIPLQSENYSYAELLKGSELEQRIALQEASSLFGWSAETQFQPVGGGLTRAKVYLFDSDGKKRVLRFLALASSHSKEWTYIQHLNLQFDLMHSVFINFI